VTNLELARGLLEQAGTRLKALDLARAEGNFAYAVRLAQEAVELSLKAMLYYVGVDPPKWHDVGSILRDNSSNFPGLPRDSIDELAWISSRLRGDRERSMYGDEAMGVPPGALYNGYDGRIAGEWAGRVYSVAGDLIAGQGPQSRR